METLVITQKTWQKRQAKLYFVALSTTVFRYSRHTLRCLHAYVRDTHWGQFNPFESLRRNCVQFGKCKPLNANKNSL